MTALRKPLVPTAAAAAAVTAVIAAVSSVALAAPACKPHTVPIHAILSAPNRVYTLPDGRQLTAATHSVGGCLPRADAPTGGALRAGSSFTIIGQSSGRLCTVSEDSDGMPIMTSFQALTVTANGFSWTPSFVVEDIDARSTGAGGNASITWREMVVTLGRTAAGELVRPKLTLPPDSLLGVAEMPVAGSGLAALGWAGYEDTPAATASYASWTQVTNLDDRNAHLGRVGVNYTTPVQGLAVGYVLSQADATDDGAKTGAFVGALRVGCGCVCAPRPEPSHTLLVRRRDAAGTVVDGRCVRMTSVKRSYICDFRGNKWCEERPATRYIRTGPWAADGTAPCVAQAVRIHMGTGDYAPAEEFGGRGGDAGRGERDGASPPLSEEEKPPPTRVASEANTSPPAKMSTFEADAPPSLSHGKVNRNARQPELPSAEPVPTSDGDPEM
ncbi:hypothetical protein MMPV_008802 [Pyropia vietnamensis]